MTTTAVRDLAWCRAAFRDLDAPLPGQPGPERVTTRRRDWASRPIEAGPTTPHVGPMPRTDELVERVVAGAGVPARRVDVVGATLLAWDEITRLGVELLQGEPEAVQALVVVRGRWDLEEPMLWHLFTHWGQAGVRARREVVRRLYTEGDLERAIARGIASGSLLRY